MAAGVLLPAGMVEGPPTKAATVLQKSKTLTRWIQFRGPKQSILAMMVAAARLLATKAQLRAATERHGRLVVVAAAVLQPGRTTTCCNRCLKDQALCTARLAMIQRCSRVQQTTSWLNEKHNGLLKMRLPRWKRRNACLQGTGSSPAGPVGTALQAPAAADGSAGCKPLRLSRSGRVERSATAFGPSCLAGLGPARVE